eukprot:Skav232972  [mRNA]  locus=scaffold1735:322793:326622:+ [translate_table: standard]
MDESDDSEFYVSPRLVTHIDDEAIGLSRSAGIGMNRAELERNQALTEWKVQDLNKERGGTFDFVVNAVVSVDYLVHPLEIFKEMLRVLKPGGMAPLDL